MRSGSKRISTSFAVILILLAILLGGFLIKYFIKPKPKTLAANTVAIHPHKKHRKKHRSKNYISADSLKRNFKTEKIVSAPVPTKSVTIKPVSIKPVTTEPFDVKPVTIKPVAIKAIPVKPIKKIPDSTRTNQPKQAFLYATYVQPNITGLVKLRAEDKFYSNSVATIPANSKVWVLEKGDTYYRVSYNNTIGFVPKWTLKEK